MILRADARALPLREACVDCVVTSPPYWGLRDYGRVGQLGLESTPDAYVAALVAVFREVARVLKPGGTVWVNMGDAYCSGTAAPRNPTTTIGADVPASWSNRCQKERIAAVGGLKAKDLVGIPWRVAFALQADGWYLRSDIIWHKPNPMPESVTDRPTKAHEYLFLLTKSERYHYDADAIREDAEYGRRLWSDVNGNMRRAHNVANLASKVGLPSATVSGSDPDAGRNKRSVWTIPTMPYAGAHFATMPEALVEPCILAGCPLGGLVLDPFLGSGTVGAVAERLGRRWVGTDLSYQPLSKARTAQRGIRFDEPEEVA